VMSNRWIPPETADLVDERFAETEEALAHDRRLRPAFWRVYKLDSESLAQVIRSRLAPAVENIVDVVESTLRSSAAEYLDEAAPGLSIEQRRDVLARAGTALGQVKLAPRGSIALRGDTRNLTAAAAVGGALVGGAASQVAPETRPAAIRLGLASIAAMAAWVAMDHTRRAGEVRRDLPSELRELVQLELAAAIEEYARTVNAAVEPVAQPR
jgi:hypothetical protein